MTIALLFLVEARGVAPKMRADGLFFSAAEVVASQGRSPSA